ncbi:MAG: MSMEG_0570 family nitrogen starvation response protein [Phormidesmis sp. RL_2_1]|nr:MSMEG_0570 family nitrogen starvation response protein [Phormidesmis sp. RL_2_1]
MPEINFKIQWPNGQQEICYSPSLVVQKYLQVGETYSVSEFLARSRTALTIASDRVQAKYGFPCSRALNQLSRIEATAAPYLEMPNGTVMVLQFEPI